MSQNAQDTFNKFLSTALNKPQKEAVEKTKGSTLVVAGAGSGKTRVITARIAHLVMNEGVIPQEIVALTFTNKAAGEMKERLQNFFMGEHMLPYVGTFHSYCLLLLRSNPSLLPFPQFSILDGNDQADLLRKIIKKNNLSKYSTATQLSYQISNLKNKIAAGIDVKDFSTPMLREVFAAYEEEKTSAHSFDFDDLILNVLSLFKSNQEFQNRFQKNIRHIMVDEYQDTSHVQHQLLKYMAIGENGKTAADSVCAVGDEDQSIYSWRGATVTNMLKFQSEFAPVSTIKIEQNYRSVQPILEAANSVIACNKLRNPKNLWSEKKAKNRIVVHQCRSGDQEAIAIAQFIKTLPASRKRSDVAILYRTHYQSRQIEEALIHNSIPYKIVGGIRFYERKEIKDLLAYLRLIVNPYDRISLLRVINCPQRGLGKKFEEQLMDGWQKNRMLDYAQLLSWMAKESDHGLTKSKQEAVEAFVKILEGFDKDSTPSTVLDKVLVRSEYLNYLRTAFDAKEAETKIENVKELLQSIVNYEQAREEENSQELTKKATLENFLHEVALLQEQIEENETADQIQMMTLHAAKGLEFHTVIIGGLEEGLLPSMKSLNSPEALEEERRLFYVGVTRAEEYLLLFTANYRNSFGQIVDQVPSRFISEMPESLIQHTSFERSNAQQMSNFYARLLGVKPPSSGMMTFGDFKRPAPAASFGAQNSSAYAGRKPMPRVSRPTSSSSSISSQNKKVVSRVRRTNKSASDSGTSKLSGASSLGGWKKNQTVIHKKFGPGLVLSVEPADGTNFYITAVFKTGKKKILSSFLNKV